jgi:hypothetical protein
MPRIEGTFPPPIHGISTVKPRNRGQGYAEQQENMRSDPVNKLQRRPSVEWLGKLRDIDVPFAIHSYTRGDDSYKVIVIPEVVLGQPNVEVYKNGVLLSSTLDVLFPISAEFVRDVKFMTIKNKTYLLNVHAIPDYKYETYTLPAGGQVTEPLVEDHPLAGTVLEKVTHVNVTVAGEYGETLSLQATSSLGIHVVSYEIPVYDPANAVETLEQRATSTIATELAAAINIGGDVFGLFAVAKGSSLAIWEAAPTSSGVVDNGRSTYDWVQVEIVTGQGDRSLVAVNQRIEKVDGLPLYAVAGTRITVRPNPRSDDGTYYLQAAPIVGDWVEGTHFHLMEEVVWTEARSPVEPYRFEETLMPYTVEVKDGAAIISPVEWKDRRTGDKDSCPPPTFLKEKSRLTSMSYFQKRLVVLADDEVHMTETEDLENWWKASAIQTLVTDPIGIASSAPDVDVLEQAVQHNRDLLVLAKNGQFKIDGKVAVTPQTVSMPLTTDYECKTSPPPVAIGNASYIPMTFGSSAGLHEYTGEKNTSQDTAYNIATHVKDYMLGTIKLMASSSSLESIVLTTTGDGDHVLFVYDQMTTREGKVLQQAWSKWIFTEETNIVNISLINDRLELAILQDGELHFKLLRLNSSEADTVTVTSVEGNGLPEIYLDDHIVIKSDNGTAVELPENYPWHEDTIVVRGAGTNYPRTLVPFTKLGNQIVFEEEIGIGNVEIGRKFTSSYIPTRPFKRDQNGETVTTDRVRVSRYRVSVVESFEMWMHIISDFYTTDDQEFNSRIMNANNNLIGYEPHTTDEVLFGFSQDAKYALAEFYTDGFLGLTIDGITWEGQYYQSSKRM